MFAFVSSSRRRDQPGAWGRIRCFLRPHLSILRNKVSTGLNLLRGSSVNKKLKCVSMRSTSLEARHHRLMLWLATTYTRTNKSHCNKRPQSSPILNITTTTLNPSVPPPPSLRLSSQTPLHVDCSEVHRWRTVRWSTTIEYRERGKGLPQP
jgi:hypothetical protein